MARKTRRGAGRTLRNLGTLFHLGATIAAGYIGAQNRAELDRAKAENLDLKNQIAAQQIGKVHNDVLLGDLKAEKMVLEIELLRKRLGLNTTKGDGDLF